MPENNRDQHSVSYMLNIQDVTEEKVICMIGFFADTHSQEQHDKVLAGLKDISATMSPLFSVTPTQQYPDIADSICNAIRENFGVDCRAIFSLAFQAYKFNTKHPLYKEAKRSG